MTDPNSRQVAGDHYRKMTYQHWDWVVDVNLPYLLGCATKYVARWRQKNGAQDLEKAIHFLEKAQERGVLYHPPYLHLDQEVNAKLTRVFLSQLDPQDAAVAKFILRNNFSTAIENITDLILSP
jgi:hypothetical protein